jgi:hypothetical protein
VHLLVEWGLRCAESGSRESATARGEMLIAVCGAPVKRKRAVVQFSVRDETTDCAVL